LGFLKLTFFNIANTAAAKKHPLSYQTPQSVHVTTAELVWCSDCAIENTLWWCKTGKKGEGMVGFGHLTNSNFSGCKLSCKVSLKLTKNVTVEEVTDTGTSDFMSHAML